MNAQLASSIWSEVVPAHSNTAEARILWVHGYGEHSGRYRRIAELLSSQGIESILFDLPGHGRSQGARGELPSLELTYDILRNLIPAKSHIPVVLFGHSLGGLIVASYALQGQESLHGVVLSSPVLGKWGAIEAFSSLDVIPDSQVLPRHLSKIPGFEESFMRDEQIYRGPMRRSALDLGAGGLNTLENLSPELNVEIPVLWLHGGKDRIAPAASAIQALARITLTDFSARVFPGGRHELLNDEESSEATHEISRFVQRVVRLNNTESLREKEA